MVVVDHVPVVHKHLNTDGMYIFMLILCTSLCSYCVHHCAHTVYVIMLTYRPGDPVTIGELHVSKEANFTGSSISKLKLPEKRKVSKRPYSYIAAMESPNGAYMCVILCVFLAYIIVGVFMT